MLFTWDTTNLCIVFRQWHIRSTASLIVSLLLLLPQPLFPAPFSLEHEGTEKSR